MLMTPPQLDPTPLFEIYRGNFGSELLIAAVAHFRIFDRFANGSKTVEELRTDLGLASRPAVVLLTALRGLRPSGRGRFGSAGPIRVAHEHLTGGAFDVSDYIRMAADSPGVLTMVERLRSNKPADSQPDEAGAAFIYREGIESAMEHEEAARRLTLALAGRALTSRRCWRSRVPLGSAHTLLDVGGGTGLYSIAFLQKNPGLRAIVWDRPEVLKVAAELAAAHGRGGSLGVSARRYVHRPTADGRCGAVVQCAA